DVHRAHLGQPRGQLRVPGDVLVHLDADEQRVAPHAGAASPNLDLTRSGISSMRSATVIPASARRAIFSAAVSSLPSPIVPAWPDLMPFVSSMKRPAMNATFRSLVARSVP